LVIGNGTVGLKSGEVAVEVFVSLLI